MPLKSKGVMGRVFQAFSTSLDFKPSHPRSGICVLHRLLSSFNIRICVGTGVVGYPQSPPPSLPPNWICIMQTFKAIYPGENISLDPTAGHLLPCRRQCTGLFSPSLVSPYLLAPLTLCHPSPSIL